MPIINKILDQAGFTLSSDFTKRKEIKNLTMLFSQAKFIADTKGEFRASKTIRQIIIGDPPVSLAVIKYENDFNQGNFDTDDAYDPLTGLWTCPQTGDYDIRSLTIMTTNVASESKPSKSVIFNISLLATLVFIHYKLCSSL